MIDPMRSKLHEIAQVLSVKGTDTKRRLLMQDTISCRDKCMRLGFRNSNVRIYIILKARCSSRLSRCGRFIKG